MLVHYLEKLIRTFYAYCYILNEWTFMQYKYVTRVSSNNFFHGIYLD